MNIWIIFLFIFFSALNAFANQVCLDMVPEIENAFNDLKVLPLGISGQIQIDKEEKGLKRFKRVGQTLSVDAERVPLLSEKRKEFYPVESVDGIIEGIHIAGRTYKSYHNAIEVFNASISYGQPEEEIQLFQGQVEPYYFKDFLLTSTPYIRDNLEGMTWFLSHGDNTDNRWSHHSFIFQPMNAVDEFTRLNLFFETDFDNTNGGQGDFLLNWIENSASGSRIDTCVYFLIHN